MFSNSCNKRRNNFKRRWLKTKFTEKAAPQTICVERRTKKMSERECCSKWKGVKSTTLGKCLKVWWREVVAFHQTTKFWGEKYELGWCQNWGGHSRNRQKSERPSHLFRACSARLAQSTLAQSDFWPPPGFEIRSLLLACNEHSQSEQISRREQPRRAPCKQMLVSCSSSELNLVNSATHRYERLKLFDVDYFAPKYLVKVTK